MSYALPHPQRSLAIPLAALALGAAGGVTAQALLDSETIVTRDVPAAISAKPDIPSSPPPVPERVSPVPRVAATGSLAGTTAPVPERVSPSPPDTGSTAPVPERISGAHTR